MLCKRMYEGLFMLVGDALLGCFDSRVSKIIVRQSSLCSRSYLIVGFQGFGAGGCLALHNGFNRDLML